MRKLKVLLSVVFIGLLATAGVFLFAQKDPLPEYCEFCYIQRSSCRNSVFSYTIFSEDHKYYITTMYSGEVSTHEITKDQYRKLIPNIDDLSLVSETDYNKYCTAILQLPNEDKKLYEYKDSYDCYEQFTKYLLVMQSLRRRYAEDDSERIAMAMSEVYEEYEVAEYYVTANNNYCRDWNGDNYSDEDREAFEKISHRLSAEYANVYLFRTGKVSIPYLGNDTKAIDSLYEKTTGRPIGNWSRERDVMHWPYKLHRGRLSSSYELLMLRYYTVFPIGTHLVYTKILTAGDRVYFYYICPQGQKIIVTDYKSSDPISKAGLVFAALRVYLTNGRLSAFHGEKVCCHILFYCSGANTMISTVYILYIALRKRFKRVP